MQITPVATTDDGRSRPNPFFPAVLLAGRTFGALYLWPFLEAWAMRDRAVHHLLDRPFWSAFGAGLSTRPDGRASAASPAQ